jgi:osmoprotectant transport system permease protein
MPASRGSSGRFAGGARVVWAELVRAWQYVQANPGLFADQLARHVALSAAALAFGALVALPLGVALTRLPRAAAEATLRAVNTTRTVPNLAILALALPFLGIGFAPSLAALTVLAVPPILTNTYVGVREVDPDAVEAARGMGMTAAQILRRIELPLAVPLLFAGIRTAAVQVVAGATLAAFIGGGGLGDFITAGIAMSDARLLLVGAVPVALLAIATEGGLGRLERWLTPRGIRTTS